MTSPFRNTSFLNDVALGNIATIQNGSLEGLNNQVILADLPIDIWGFSGTYTGQPNITAETVEIISTSANDTAAGIGAQSITIEGLTSQAATEYTTETITTNGFTPVQSVQQYYRVIRATVNTAGTLGQNAGLVVCRQSSDINNQFALINNADIFNTSQGAVYTVPNNRILNFINGIITVGNTAGDPTPITMSLLVRPLGGLYTAVKQFVVINNAIIDCALVNTVPPLSDIKFQVTNVANNGNVNISVNFNFILNAF